MSGEDTERRMTLICRKKKLSMEREGEGWQCSSMCCNMFSEGIVKSQWRATKMQDMTMLVLHLAYQQRDYWATTLSCQVALGRGWLSFFFYFGGTKFTHAQYINMMYVLDLTRQKFDVWIGVTFLTDNATRQRAAEMREPIQTSNFRQIQFVLLNSTRQKCDVWTGP